jgi:D-methionine transport system permease protein
MHLNEMLQLLVSPTIETIMMVFISSAVAFFLGMPMGITLYLTQDKGLIPNKAVFRIMDALVNTCRSLPFIILMILLFPLSRIIVGTTIGTAATIVPLSIGASPFVGRIVENALNEVNAGIIEAVHSMGASNSEIIFKVVIPEALPALISGMTLSVINILGYSAMAGAIGGGGLGDLAIRYGFHRFQTDVLIVSVVVIIILVQAIQFTGNKLADAVYAKRAIK